MDLASRVAFVHAQVVCAQAELLAMQAANAARLEQGHSPAYDEEAFRAVPDQFLVGHNAVIEYLREG